MGVGSVGAVGGASDIAVCEEVGSAVEVVVMGYVGGGDVKGARAKMDIKVEVVKMVCWLIGGGLVGGCGSLQSGLATRLTRGNSMTERGAMHRTRLVRKPLADQRISLLDLRSYYPSVDCPLIVAFSLPIRQMSILHSNSTS